MPRHNVAMVIGLYAITLISSLTIQIPIQLQLDSAGYSLPLIRRLIVTDWIRKLPMTAAALLMLWMMSLLLRPPR